MTEAVLDVKVGAIADKIRGASRGESSREKSALSTTTAHDLPDPLSLTSIIKILAPALSHGRRAEARLVTGNKRAFFTSKGCSRVYVPYPPFETGPALRIISCGLALQASPSKETVAALPLQDLRPTELLALAHIEGEIAMAWAIRHWPGLERDLRRWLPGMRPRNDLLDDTTWHSNTLVEMALQLAQRQPIKNELPTLLGRLPVDEHASRAISSIFRAKGRMPYSMRKSQPVKTLFAIPVGGSGGARSKNIQPPASLDDETESLVERKIGIPYDEWNIHTQRYRNTHVSVIETNAFASAGATTRPPAEIMRWFQLSPSKSWQRGLEDGTDLDVDAYVDQHCATIAGDAVDGRCYRTLDNGRRDVATALLLDGSASLGTDGGLHLRLQLACADALALSLARANEPHAVFAFTGNTRHRVEISVLKDFHQASAVMPGNTGLQTVGYTRLGAPLRHLTRRLLAVAAERRIILSIGDGLPSDNGYEGRYAWADVAKAVEEAEQAGVLIYHIGVGRVKLDPLKECFGIHRSQRISSLRDLPRILSQVHQRLCDL